MEIGMSIIPGLAIQIIRDIIHMNIFVFVKEEIYFSNWIRVLNPSLS